MTDKMFDRYVEQTMNLYNKNKDGQLTEKDVYFY
jgi:hypothetical protein